MRARRPVLVVVLVGVVATLVAAASQPTAQRSGSGASPTAAPWAVHANPPALPSANPPDPEHHDTSPPLRTIPPAPPTPPENRGRPEREIPGPQSGTEPDPVVQTGRGRTAAPSLAQSFLGLGSGFSGPQASRSPDSAPPDTNGAV